VRPGNVAIIGFGAIAQDLISILKGAPDGPPDQISVLVRDGRQENTIATLADPSILVTTDIDGLLATRPDVVVECASHSSVTAHGPSILRNGIDLIVASVGAFSDPDLANALEKAADQSDSQCVVPSGAIGAIDALGAARLSGLNSVTYTGRKPPKAWEGTPAQGVADLANLTKPCVFFEGSAREAAQKFPKNANVAATLALAGMGMDATLVRLIADPDTSENVHEFDVSSEALDFSVRLVGKPSPLNPKTSRSTVYSIARAVLNRRAAIAI
jgi:aspartate dehydrogenase